MLLASMKTFTPLSRVSPLSFNPLLLASTYTVPEMAARCVMPKFAVVMTVLAGASFGFYEIRAPVGLVNKVGGASTGLGGALLMGLTMGVVAAPCIGPVILGLLVWLSTWGSESS